MDGVSLMTAYAKLVTVGKIAALKIKNSRPVVETIALAMANAALGNASVCHHSKVKTAVYRSTTSVLVEWRKKRALEKVNASITNVSVCQVLLETTVLRLRSARVTAAEMEYAKMGAATADLRSVE